MPIAATSSSVERSLVLSARAGDSASFELLIRRQIDRLYGAARLVLQDADLAEDAVQAALIRAWRDLPSLRDVDRFGPWLQKLLMHACYDEARRKRRWRADIRVLKPVNEQIGVDPTLDDRDVIERGFRRLSIDHRRILILHFYLDLSAVEIGERLGIPPGTARSRLHYALASLRAALEADEREHGNASGTVA